MRSHLMVRTSHTRRWETARRIWPGSSTGSATSTLCGMWTCSASGSAAWRGSRESTGECELIDGKPGGVSVTTAARIAALSKPSQVLVSRTVKDLVAGLGFTFHDPGEHHLKGLRDPWRVHEATHRPSSYNFGTRNLVVGGTGFEPV